MIYLITAITDFAAFLVVFAVGRQLAEQETGAFLMGVVGALFAGAATVTNALAGVLSDRAGRRPVCTFGSVLLLASVGCLSVLDPRRWPFVAAYTSVGAALGLIYPPLIAWLGRGRTGRNALRAYLAFCLAFNAGIAAGQVTGGWLFNEIGRSAPFVAALGLVTLGLLLIVQLHDHHPAIGGTATPPEAAHDDAYRARSAAFARLCWIANFGGTFSYSVVLNLFPKLSVSLGVPADRHGLLLGAGRLTTIVAFCVMYTSAFWVHRFVVSLAVQILGIVGLMCLVLTESVTGLLAGLAALGVLGGYNYFAGLYYSTDRRGDEQMGTGSGIHEATLALGLAGGSLFGGVAGSLQGDRAPFMLAALVVALLALVQIRLYFGQWRLRR